jgi:hypothetical protein
MTARLIWCALIWCVMGWPAVMHGIARIICAIAYDPTPAPIVLRPASRAYITQYAQAVEN